MLSNISLSLFNLSAQSSVVQAGRVMQVNAITISSGASVSHGSAINAFQRGTDLAAVEVKSTASLLEEQIAKMLE